MHEKTGRLAKEAARVACKLDARKGKMLGTDCARSREKNVVDGEEVEDIEEFYIPESYCRQGGRRYQRHMLHSRD